MPMQDESMSLLYLPSGEWPEKKIPLSLSLLSSGVVFTMQMVCCLREWSSGEIFIMQFDKQMQGLEEAP